MAENGGAGAASAHDRLLAGENTVQLVDIGELTYMSVVRSAIRAGILDPNVVTERAEATELRHIVSLYRSLSLQRGPALERSGNAPDGPFNMFRLRTLWRHAATRPYDEELVRAWRRCELGDVYDVLRNERNRLQHARAEITVADGALLASAVLVITKVAESGLIAPEALKTLQDDALNVLAGIGVRPARADPPRVAESPKPLPTINPKVLTNIDTRLAEMHLLISELPQSLREQLTRDSTGTRSPGGTRVHRGLDAMSRILELRNRIFMENEKLQGWENPCQRPFAKAWLDELDVAGAPKTVAELMSVRGVHARFQQHRRVMEPILRKHGNAILQILNERAAGGTGHVSSQSPGPPHPSEQDLRSLRSDDDIVPPGMDRPRKAGPSAELTEDDIPF